MKKLFRISVLALSILPLTISAGFTFIAFMEGNLFTLVFAAPLIIYGEYVYNTVKEFKL